MRAVPRYDRSALLSAYLNVMADLRLDRTHALAHARRAYLSKLERLFGLDFSLIPGNPAKGGMSRFMLLHFLRSTANSYLSIRTPWSDYLAAGALLDAMRRAGIADSVEQMSRSIRDTSETMRTQHIELLDTLLRNLMGEHADDVFELNDPAAQGIVIPDPEAEWD